MYHVTVGRFQGYIASAWPELTPRQLRRVVTALYELQGNALRRELLAALFEWPSRLARLILTTDRLRALSPRLIFLLNEPPALTTLPFAHVRPRVLGPRYYGPAAGLKNLQFLEFTIADSLFIQWQRTQQEHVLDQLLATLWRPRRQDYNPAAEDFDGDTRAPFNPQHIERYARALCRLPLATKRVLALFYRGQPRPVRKAL